MTAFEPVDLESLEPAAASGAERYEQARPGLELFEYPGTDALPRLRRWFEELGFTVLELTASATSVLARITTDPESGASTLVPINAGQWVTATLGTSGRVSFTTSDARPSLYGYRPVIAPHDEEDA